MVRYLIPAIVCFEGKAADLTGVAKTRQSNHPSNVGLEFECQCYESFWNLKAWKLQTLRYSPRINLETHLWIPLGVFMNNETYLIP